MSSLPNSSVFSYLPKVEGLNLNHSNYLAQYVHPNGRVILTAVPVHGKYKDTGEPIINTGNFIGFEVCFNGYLGFLGIGEIEKLKEYVHFALIREVG